MIDRRGPFKRAVKTIQRLAGNSFAEAELLVYENERYDPRNPEAITSPHRQLVKVFDETVQHQHVDGNKVEQGDRVLLIDPDLVHVDLKITDEVVFEKVTYQVIGIQRLVQDIVMLVQLRGMS